MAELATIGRPYAEALFDAAPADDRRAWGEQLQALARIAADPSLRQYADNPKTSDTQVFDLVASVSGMSLHPGIANFLRAFVENGRLAALPEVAAQYQALVNAGSGVSDAVIYSAFPIDMAQQGEVVAALERRFGRRLSGTVQVDPSLIGGIRVVVGDEVLDTSVRGQLDRMKVALSA